MILDERQKALSMAILRAAVAGYIIYLGVSLIRDQLTGGSTLAPWFSWVCGVLFVLAGPGFIWYSWKQYRAATAKKPEAPLESTAEEPSEAEK